MNLIVKTLTYASQNIGDLLAATGEHFLLVTVPLAIAMAIGLPLGFLSSRSRLVAALASGGFNSLRVIPSIAILFVAIPQFGLSFQSAAIALTILAIPPILINTDVAFREINAEYLEAARGTGMTPYQVWYRVEVPLALPTAIAGIKTATVEAIASATLAAFIGAGGLGSFIVLGFSLYDNAILLTGAIPVALMALLAELSLSALQNRFQPPTI